MSDFESLRKDIAGFGESVERAMEAQNRLTDAHGTEIERLWADNAALREDLHALANRVETLTRARLTEPAEVARAMVFDDDGQTARCEVCLGSGTTPLGGRCRACNGMGRVVSQRKLPR